MVEGRRAAQRRIPAVGVTLRVHPGVAPLLAGGDAHIPAEARVVRRCEAERADGAALDRLGLFHRARGVVGPLVAREHRRRTAQVRHHFAGDVGAGPIVVVAERRGTDAVADERDRRIFDTDLLAQGVGPEQVVFAVGQRLGPGRRTHLHGASALDHHAVAQRHPLPEAAIFAGRRESEAGDRLFDVLQRRLVSGGAEATALEPIVGQHAHVLLDLAALKCLERGFDLGGIE